MDSNILKYRVIWIGVLISNLCFTLILPFIPLYLINLGIKENIEVWSSFIVIASYIGATISSPIWGALSDKFGHKTMIVRAGLANGIIYILCAFVQGPVQLIILRVLYGLNSGFMPAANAIVTEMSSKEDVGKRISSLQNAVLGGQLLGPLAGGILSSLTTISMSFFIAGLAMVLNTIMIIILIENSKKNYNKNTSKKSIKKYITGSFEYPELKNFLFIVFLFQVTAGMIFPILSTYIMDIKIEHIFRILTTYLFKDDMYSFLTGLIFSIPGILAFFAIKRWSNRGEKKGYYSNLKVGLLMTSICFFFTPILPSFLFLIVLRGVQGIFSASIIPALSTLMAQNVGEENRGTAFSLFNSIRSLGSIVGPLLGGGIAFLVGNYGVFIGGGIILFIAFMFTLITQKKKIDELASE
ncbi:MFS transporter [Lysinibacillus sp. NPDC097195]|uniref:MFS transporter n=1 Tax=Lysinibacillus sp. NPDC097195 TaxID=3364141 RepID=UPI0037F6624B